MAKRLPRPHPDDSGSDARKRVVELSEAEKVAGDLAVLVAREHARANEEQAKREAAEAIASQLAVLLVQDHAELERERAARQRAEAQASELSALVLREEDRMPRFVPAPRAPRPARSLQRMS